MHGAVDESSERRSRLGSGRGHKPRCELLQFGFLFLDALAQFQEAERVYSNAELTLEILRG
jgi:hypothetical protein